MLRHYTATARWFNIDNAVSSITRRGGVDNLSVSYIIIIIIGWRVLGRS